MQRSTRARRPAKPTKGSPSSDPSTAPAAPLDTDGAALVCAIEAAKGRSPDDARDEIVVAKRMEKGGAR